MRVLWFSVTPSLYSKNPLYNGGGWIASLEGELKKNKSIELGVAFEFCDDKFKVCENGVTYYPINVWKTKKKLRRRVFSRYNSYFWYGMVFWINTKLYKDTRNNTSTRFYYCV